MELSVKYFPSFMVLPLFLAMAAGVSGSTGYQSTIDYLIDYVDRSPYTFVRNGRHYLGAEAAEHMGRKYRHFKNEIKTPEDFIERCASKSLLTGRPYTVVTLEGQRLRTDEWLTQVLADYRATAASEDKSKTGSTATTKPKADAQGD